MKRYSLSIEDAKKYSEILVDKTKAEEIYFDTVGRSLETLAKAKDETTFRKIIDSCTRCLKAIDNPEDRRRDEPLAFLEWLCVSMDHGFATVGFEALANKAGIIREQLPLRQTQKFFREIYGSHFFYSNPLHN